MNQKILHTPEGVRDIYPLECRQKLALQNKLHNTLKSYAYQDIETPTLEFSEVFSKEKGSLDSKELYRFFDRDGNILVLRPDITPSIARAISSTLQEQDFYGKFCYSGHTFINHTSYQGRLKENTQIGAEMIGENSVEADAEMLAVVADLLKTAGLEEFQVTLSHSAFFNALISEANLDVQTESTLRELCENKNYFGVESLLDKCAISQEIRNAFLALPELVGGPEILEKAKAVAPNCLASAAVERLEEIVEVLEMYDILSYINFDLSMTGTYGYYTGIIFRAYTFGTGDAIIKGGRYDKLLNHFGKDIPAIGFAVVVDEVFNALSRQKIEIEYELDNYIVIYEEAIRKQGISFANRFRKSGHVVDTIKKSPTREIEEYFTYGKNSFGKYMFYLYGEETMDVYNLSNGLKKTINLKGSNLVI